MARVFPKFLAVTFNTAMLAGCAQIGVPVPPSLELPKPVNDLRVTRTGDKIHLRWTTPTKITDGQIILHLGPTRICRSLQVPMTECDTIVGQIPPAAASSSKASSEYTDQLRAAVKPGPTGLASYAVEVLNANGRSAGLSNPVAVSLLPIPPPPQKLAAQVTPQGVLLTWNWPESLPSGSLVEFPLRIYRRDENGKSEASAGEISFRAQAEPQFLDQSLEWEHIYYYWAAFVLPASDQANGGLEVEGEDSLEVKVFVHDVFPPAVPSGLQAVFSSVGQPNFIDLTWTPNTDAELAGYNVYRREESAQPIKINSELAKIPTYRDRDLRPGTKYYYSVTAVDLRGNEGGHSEESSDSVPKIP